MPIFQPSFLQFPFSMSNIFQSSSLPREDSLIQTNSNRILWINLIIKGSLKVPMSTKTLLDKPTATSLGPQLQRLEPVDILGIEEHIPNGNDLLVDLERMTRENGTLGNDTGLVWCCDGACTDELEVVDRHFAVGCGVEDLGVLVLFVLEDEDGDGAEGERSNPGGDGAAAGMQVAVEFVDVVGGVVADGEDGVDDHAARAALDEELFLGLQRLFHVGAQGHVDIDHGVFVFVTQQGEER